MHSRSQDRIGRGAATVLLILFCQGGLASAAAQNRSRHCVTAAEVWPVVAGKFARGMPDGDVPRIEDLELAVSLPVRGETDFRVSSVCWDQTAGRTRVRMECKPKASCLPFFVYVRSAMNAEWEQCAVVPRTGPSSAKIVISSGDWVDLLWESAGIRMSARGRSLDAAGIGESIGIRTPAGRTVHGRVLGPHKVQLGGAW